MNPINIKDYLKYYIGCDVIVDGEHRGNFRGGSLIPNTIDQIYYDIHDYKAMKFEGVDFSMPYNDDTSEDCRIKPILRRIESLVNHELLHIAKLAFFDKPMNYPDRDYRIVTEPGSTSHAIRIDNDWFEKELRIGHLSCNMWLSWKSAQTERIFNQPAIFHYLLSLGIDLFGLIEAGLAVDADTLNQQTEAK